jgi:hypothetical protein
MLVRPGVEVNTVKRDPLRTNANRRHSRADIAIEAILVHAQIAWRIS